MDQFCLSLHGPVIYILGGVILDFLVLVGFFCCCTSSEHWLRKLQGALFSVELACSFPHFLYLWAQTVPSLHTWKCHGHCS